MNIGIIGIDAAAQRSNFGLSHVDFDSDSGRATLIELAGPIDYKLDPLSTVLGWISEHDVCLFAVDAPLGWPKALGQTLQSHQAGMPVPSDPDSLFRRTTDRFIKKHLGKTPLDVGADRIARTAHGALGFLEALRKETRTPLPLAWVPGLQSGSAVIEVYPAATLIAANAMPKSSYKSGNDTKGPRLEIIAWLSSVFDDVDATDEVRLEMSDDIIDALIAAQAGADFLRSEVVSPDDSSIFKQEGWIWVRDGAWADTVPDLMRPKRQEAKIYPFKTAL